MPKVDSWSMADIENTENIESTLSTLTTHQIIWHNKRIHYLKITSSHFFTVQEN